MRTPRHYCVYAAPTATALALVLASAIVGCAGRSKEPVLISPLPTLAPYSQAQGEVLWAVAPVRNESGASIAPVDQISEQLTSAVEEVRGVRAVPLSRTLAAMRALELTGLSSQRDLQRLADALGVEAVLVASLTRYDPYTPGLGLSLGLYARPGGLGLPPEAATAAAPAELRAAAAEQPPTIARPPLAPVSTWSENFDGKNHGVQLAVRAYAQGRQHGGGATAQGWRRYLRSMPLFTEFSVAESVRGLMREEWLRAGISPPPMGPGPAAMTEEGSSQGADTGGTHGQ